ncbi:hypothetical protein GCM10023336_31080 [Streptomyces similanensis]|uniref:Transposase n=1 Tax=Streptomyces similanensis TaxID=1274988 RepID=A0ABP9KGY9_9ACTN
MAQGPPAALGATLDLLVDAVLTAVAHAAHWNRLHRHAQQQATAEQTLVHLQAASAYIAEPVRSRHGVRLQVPSKLPASKAAHRSNARIVRPCRRKLQELGRVQLISLPEAATHDRQPSAYIGQAVFAE